MIIKDFIDELSVLGAVNNSDICGALKLINAARRLVYPMDDWTGTIDYGCVNLCEKCFYLPYHIETVRDIWNCNCELNLGDEIWSSISTGSLSECCGDRAGVTRTDRSAGIPVQAPLGSVIGVGINDELDAGVTIRPTIRNAMGSLDTENLTVKEYGEIVWGELVAGVIESVQKPPTKGQITMFYKDNCGVVCRLHVYQPEEVSPRYYLYKSTCQSGCAIIKGKKKFFPYMESDMYKELDIQGVNGLAYAIKAIEHQRTGQHQEFTAALSITRSLLERNKEDLKKTSEPAKAAVTQIHHPVSNKTYGYQ